MRYEARITAYDMMDQVCVGAMVRGDGDDPLRPPVIAFSASVIATGTGELEPRDWLRDALVALLEVL